MVPNDELLFRALTGRATDEERKVVDEWRSRSVGNAQQYEDLARLLHVSLLGDEFPSLATSPGLDDVLGHRQTAGDGQDVESRRRPALWWHTSDRMRVVLAAAAVVIGILIGGGGYALGWILAPTEPLAAVAEAHEFVTGPDETANVILSDGTVIKLGGGSRLRIPDQTLRREVTISGRAYFAVAKDEARPFTVHTPEGTVRVLGTRFSLETSGEDLRLIVVEGAVGLSAAREEVELKANQMARVIKGKPLPIVDIPNLSGLTDWVGDFLAFQDTPLEDAIGEIEQKYSVEITTTDEHLKARTITAWFAGDTLEEVMEVVCIIASAECVIDGSQVTIDAKG